MLSSLTMIELIPVAIINKKHFSGSLKKEKKEIKTFHFTGKSRGKEIFKECGDSEILMNHPNTECLE